MAVVGIDLGTTTSEVAIYRDDNVEIIKNLQEGDSFVVPSVVCIDKDKITVGIKAKNVAILRPKSIVREVKRLIGTDKIIKVDQKQYSPVLISSYIIRKLKEVAEFYLGEDVTEAVITVPANFNERQRRETKKAGILAGLKVNRIINEPSAAAIAYGIKNIGENIKILVYDFGGGTVDVSILELYNGILDVKASRGNNNIGGKNIDEVIIKYIFDEFYRQNSVKLDLNNLRVKSALKDAAEECKKNLSCQDKWEVIVPYICQDIEGNTLDLNIEITRELFNSMIKDIVYDTEHIIDDALLGAGIDESSIDKVILVGGSTRIPLVRDMIEEKFGLDKVAHGVDPDQVVAAGAAIEAAVKDDSCNSSIIIADSCSHTLGVEVLGQKFDPLIKRDTKLPARVTKRYKTVEDYQDEAVINIYEGEYGDVTKNILLDTIVIDGIPTSPKGDEVIDITFSYDLNAILDVSVKIVSTGKSETKKVTSVRDVEYGENEIYATSEDNNLNEDKEDYTNIYSEVVDLVNYANRKLEEYDKDIVANVKSIMQDLLRALQKDDFKECRNLEHRMLKIMNIE